MSAEVMNLKILKISIIALLVILITVFSGCSNKNAETTTSTDDKIAEKTERLSR